MEKAVSGPWYRLCQFIVISCALFAGGCLPNDDGQSATSKQPKLGSIGSSGNAGVNRSEKGDALIGGAANLLEQVAARSDEPGSRKTALVTEASLSPAALLTAASDIAEAAIGDAAANVALDSFFKALSALESGRAKGPVTILHLGDSHIAADRFSGDMRDEFQSRFGNAGRGMLMPGLYLARGVKFDRGGEWEAALSTGSAPGPYGLTGVKMSARTRQDWLRLTATDRPFAWAEITLETGPGQGNALIALDGDVKLVPCRAPSPSWTTIRLEQQAREITIRPKGDGMVSVHSVTIGNAKPGVRYINLGLPGATAATPLSWDSAELAGDLKRIAPDLIVLGYGTEESFDDNLSLGEYENKVRRVLARLRDAAPQASLLVIGPPDVARLPHYAQGPGRASDVCRALSPQERASYAKRIKSGDPRLARWHPPLRLDEVRQILRRAAAASQAFFWDWSKIMGGTCGIHAWVHGDPPLAANDHIHFTEEGSRRSARLLFRELMTGFDSFDRAATAEASGWKAAVSQTAAPPKSSR